MNWTNTIIVLLALAVTISTMAYCAKSSDKEVTTL